METWHTLLEYLEGQSIHNIFQYLEGCASQQDSMYCQYLQIPSPPPCAPEGSSNPPIYFQYLLGASTIFQHNTYCGAKPSFGRPYPPHFSHIGKHNFGPPKSETSNISILAGVGPGARVQYIAQYLQGWGDKTQDPYLEGGKTSFPLSLTLVPLRIGQ